MSMAPAATTTDWTQLEANPMAMQRFNGPCRFLARASAAQGVNPPARHRRRVAGISKARASGSAPDPG
jgi:hypothetical protein